MNYKELDVITLDDDTKYVIVDIIDYQNKKYGFLVDINHSENIMYVELKPNNTITAIGSKHMNLMNRLNLLLARDMKKIRNLVKSFETEE